MGLGMGVLWTAIGLFFLISEWTGHESFTVPKTGINWGWILIVLGIWRTWWWWISVEKPRRRRLSFQADRRQMDLEMDQEIAALETETEAALEAETEAALEAETEAALEAETEAALEAETEALEQEKN